MHQAAATVNAVVSPLGPLASLSQAEIARLLDRGGSGCYSLLRDCCLAVLASGSGLDDGSALLARYPHFAINLHAQERGLRLELQSAPAEAFVDGELIRGVREHLWAVLRDVVYVAEEIENPARFDLGQAIGTTDAVFHVLRHAGVLDPERETGLVVCWGGHAIPRAEYDYAKEVGYALGLRGLDICTGCGPGAMKGPMKGATIAHAKQRLADGRYVGLTEPGIIAAEAPNPITNALVILPDIEKRLEAFVRVAHAIVIFPGGAGTLEELLYLLGILTDPANAGCELPIVLTGPSSAAAWLRGVDQFIGATLGNAAQARYQVVIGEPTQVAREIASGVGWLRESRQQRGDSFQFDWRLRIDRAYQVPFVPSHEAMRALDLRLDQAPQELAVNLRRAFSGIVAGNVKADGIARVRRHGPFELFADANLLAALDLLLERLVKDGRMKLPGNQYEPCFRLRTRHAVAA